MNGGVKTGKALVDDAALAGACAAAIPSPKHEGLLRSIGRTAPNLAFKVALVRDGWYRMGGIVDGNGERFAADIRAWVEEESNGDVFDLIARYADAGLLATRLCGKSVYLTARYGEEPLDFIQVEVEETQEVVDRVLIAEDTVAEDLEELIDPVDPERLDPKPIGGPRYHLRRFIDFGTYLTSGGVAADGASHKNFLRFIDEWKNSSASIESHFGDFWVLTLLPYTDRFGERRYNVKPRAIQVDDMPGIEADEVDPGLALGRALQKYDKAAGYPMAWFFATVSGALSHKVAEAAAMDMKNGFAYLPKRDVTVLEGWVNDPYSL